MMSDEHGLSIVFDQYFAYTSSRDGSNENRYVVEVQ